MDVMGTTAPSPSLPTKTKNFNLTIELSTQSNADNVSSFCIGPVPFVEADSSLGKLPRQNGPINDRLSSAPQRTTWVTAVHSRNEKGPGTMTTWAEREETTSGDIYENLKLNVFNKVQCSAPGKDVKASDSSQVKERRRKTPKVEVCQQDFKTVVKILVKDLPASEKEEKRPNENVDQDLEYGNLYENDHVRTREFRREDDRGIYENVFVSGCENEPVDYQNVFAADCYYANLDAERPLVDSLDPRLSVLQAIEASDRYVCAGDEGENDVYENVISGNSVYENERFYNDEERHSDRESLTEREAEGEGTNETASAEITLTPTRAGVKGKSESAQVSAFKDPFDSGTSSDVDALSTTFLNARKGNVVVTIKSFHGDEQKKEEGVHKRAESLTSSGLGADSDESDDDKSNISCDSLNSSEPCTQSNSEDHGYHTPILEDKMGSPVETIGYDAAREQINSNRRLELVDKSFHCEDTTTKLSGEDPGKKQVEKSADPTMEAPLRAKRTATTSLQEECNEDGQKCLPKSLLRDIESRSVRLSSTFPNGEGRENVKNSVAQAILCLESTSNQENAGLGYGNLRPVVGGSDKKPLVVETTYEDQKRKNKNKNVLLNQIRAIEVDTDKFYKFHISENCREEKGAEDETFAGIKDYLSRDRASAITSAKGTIRGVKNRVKAGIATFLHMHENKSYKNRDAGKVVVYTTTMGIVRETYHKCLKVKQILRTLMVKFEERDVFMSAEAQEDIRARMKCNAILVPQVFVEGQHIGDAETIERLNEIGELRTILKPYKSLDTCSTCKVCGGYRLLPCSVCKGSKKSVHRNHFTAGFVSLKCMNCDQVGLVRCHAC